MARRLSRAPTEAANAKLRTHPVVPGDLRPMRREELVPKLTIPRQGGGQICLLR